MHVAFEELQRFQTLPEIARASGVSRAVADAALTRAGVFPDGVVAAGRSNLVPIFAAPRVARIIEIVNGGAGTHVPIEAQL